MGCHLLPKVEAGHKCHRNGLVPHVHFRITQIVNFVKCVKQQKWAGPVENAAKKGNRQRSANLGSLAPDAPHCGHISHNVQPKRVRDHGCQMQLFIINRQQQWHT